MSTRNSMLPSIVQNPVTCISTEAPFSVLYTNTMNFFRVRVPGRTEFRRQCEGNDSVTRGISSRAISIVNSAGLADNNNNNDNNENGNGGGKHGNDDTTEHHCASARRSDIEHELARTIENRGDIETTRSHFAAPMHGVSQNIMSQISHLCFGFLGRSRINFSSQKISRRPPSNERLKKRNSQRRNRWLNHILCLNIFLLWPSKWFDLISEVNFVDVILFIHPIKTLFETSSKICLICLTWYLILTFLLFWVDFFLCTEWSDGGFTDWDISEIFIRSMLIFILCFSSTMS